MPKPLKINEKVQKKIEQKTKTFQRLFDKLHKKSQLRKNVLIKGWKKLKIGDQGTVSILCQARVGRGKDIRQCRKAAALGYLLCRAHGGMKKKELAIKEEIHKSVGIYSGKGKMALQTELKEVENIDPEQLSDTTDELKLSIALLRSYLKGHEDKEIAARPGQLMWLVSEISRMKKDHFEIKHAKNVTFTRDQFVYIFTAIRLIIFDVVKDPEQLEELSRRIKEIGEGIGKDGFKAI